MTTTRTITSYRIVDHGIEHAEYFEGHGTAFTEYDHTALGCGDNFAEAIDDALESMAQGGETSGVDFTAFERTMKIDNPEYCRGNGDLIVWAKGPSASKQFQQYNPDAYDEDSDEWDMAGCALYYYVSIDYTVSDGAV